MNFLLDHDVPDDVVYSLQALGHEVHKLRDVLPATAADEQVLCVAAERNNVLITCNRGFSGTRATHGPRRDHHTRSP